MSYYNESEPDSLLYVDIKSVNPDTILDFSLNQFEMSNFVRDVISEETISCFAEVVPYEIVTTIFNETRYVWNKIFINRLLSVIKNGVYSNGLANNEKLLIKDYIDFKYNNTVESSPLLISLDEYIGAM